MAVPVELEFYLRSTISWAPEHEKLWKCVTALGPKGPNGKRPAYNHAVQTYDDLIRLIEARKAWPNYDVYLDQGMLRMADTRMSNDGFMNIDRTVKNTVLMNNLYIDIDAKDYGNSSAAVDAAFASFRKASQMPEPTLAVRSGSGGLHAYWGHEPVDVETWKPIAEALKACCPANGLKIDPAVTADAARILRLPTTLNYKHNPPVPVTIDVALTSGQRYSTLALQGILAKFIGAKRVKTSGGGSTTAANVSPLAKNFMGEEQQWPKLPIDTIAINCPMVAQTLADGGAGKDEPAWSNDIYLAAHTLDPVDAAHRLSNGHAEYDKADTDKKLAEKQKAIAANDRGWPGCKIFNHAACQTCPLRVQDRSPIFFGHLVKTQPQPMQPAYDLDPLMPEGYWRNVNDHVLTNGQYGAIDVLGRPLLDGGTDPSTGELVLKIAVAGVERWGSCATNKHTAAAVCEGLAKGTRSAILAPNANAQKAIMSFTMAWTKHLQNIKRHTVPTSFGWTGGKDKEFVFGEEKFTATGPIAVYRGATADPKYQRAGELQPWTNALPLVYGNPSLQLAVASAFAAPLVYLTCDYSLTLSIFSHQSGYGKSTAMKIAQAVWGDPRTGMSMLDDTENSVNKKINDLKNLPIYWDEMKTKEQIDKIVRVVFANSQGRGKARLDRSSNPMDIGSSTTMLAIASNHGIIPSIYRNTGGTNAGGLRVFEIEVPPMVSNISASVSESLVIKLNENYGSAGAIYADFIVKNRAQVEQTIATLSDNLDKTFRFEKEERFWKNTMVTLIAGAYFANQIGLTKFDIDAMLACLAETLKELRTDLRNQPYTMVGAQAGTDALTEMIADIRGRNVVHTDIVPAPTGGRPPPVVALPYTDPGRLGDVWMQIGENDGRILARVRPFEDWLTDRKYPVDLVLKALRQDYVVDKRKATVGAGVPFLDVAKGRGWCYELTPKVAPSRSPSSPSSSFGSPGPS